LDFAVTFHFVPAGIRVRERELPNVLSPATD